jgi:hypothetical protein
VSAAAVVMIVEGVLLGVAILFVVALLRSHAEILRRLTAIEEGVSPVGRVSRPRSTGGAASAAEVSARDIVGETLGGDTVKLAFGEGLPRTLLAFLGSGCAACVPLWDGLRDGARGPAGARVVVVTKGPEQESLVRLRSLAPARAEVVMSTAAWQDFEVPATPHFVLVGSDTRHVLGRGSATSWEQLGTLLADAEADSSLQRARSSSDRAARAEQALAAAGITAGHPSLYPSRSSGDRTSEPGGAGSQGSGR